MARLIISFLCVLLFWPMLAGSETSNQQAINPTYKKVKVLASTYYAYKWSDQGRYRQVSRNGKRLGNFVALNFLPGGSVVMIPTLFQTTTFEVADTFGGSGKGYFQGKDYWKVDILRNKDEWYDDFDYPLDLYIVKVNKSGPVKNEQVRKNAKRFLPH